MPRLIALSQIEGGTKIKEDIEEIKEKMGTIKKTAVFYFKEYSGLEEEIQIHIPYKGTVAKLTATTLSDIDDLLFDVWIGGAKAGTWTIEDGFQEWDVNLAIDHEPMRIVLQAGSPYAKHININAEIYI